MKAVVLEDYAIQQGDLDWSGVKALVPDITRYGRTAQDLPMVQVHLVYPDHPM